MKKLIVFLIVIVVILPTFVFATEYGDDNFSINVPESMQPVLENSFTDEAGNNINIQINYYDSNEKVEYTEEFLNELTNEIMNNIGEYKKEIKAQIIEQYGDSITESTIDGLLDTLKYNDFLVKEITTFGADNYQCFHYISDVSMGNINQYAETYQAYLDGTIYTLTISSTDSTFFEGEEIKEAVKSFKIKNYEAMIETANNSENAETKMSSNDGLIASKNQIIIDVVVLATLIIIAIIVIKKKKSK